MSRGSSSVTSHAAKEKPKEPEKKEKPDERLIGFVFPGEHNKGKIPIDFTVDPKTGRRNGVAQWGIDKCDLRKGIEGATLPPLYTWKLGRWLNEFDSIDVPMDNIRTPGMTKAADDMLQHDFCIWMVTGEGTPGDYTYRAYLLPKEIATQAQIPKHPVMWAQGQKKGKAGTFTAEVNWRWGRSPTNSERNYHLSWHLLQEGKLPSDAWSYQGKSEPPKALTKPSTPPVAPKATQAPALPAGIRFRCSGCGHWYDENGFKAHAKAGICPGKDSAGFTDWTVMCHKECGCEVLAGSELGLKTLDHVSACKPGFPRPKPEPVQAAAQTEGGDAVAETVTEKKDESKEVVMNG